MNVNRLPIVIEDSRFLVVELHSEEILFEGRSKGFGFTQFHPHTNEEVGCLIVTVSQTAQKVWSKNLERDVSDDEIYNVIRNLLFRIVSSGRIPYEPSKHKEICRRIEFVPQETYYDNDRDVYFVNARETPEALIHNYLYSLPRFKDEILKRHILFTLNHLYRDNVENVIDKEDLKRILFAPKNDFEVILARLLKKGLVYQEHRTRRISENEWGGMLVLRITPEGNEYVETGFKETPQQNTTYLNNYGKVALGHIVDAMTKGDASPIQVTLEAIENKTNE